MPPIYSVAVFCGSKFGHDPIFREAAAAFGTGLAQAGIRLVFGAGRVGLMGVLADATLAAGGHVIGVVPDFLRRWEVAHDGLTELLITDSMHARKTKMFELSDAAVMLPGGLGTLDETIELITWRQLRLHDKPIILCDVAGSTAPLIAAIEATIANGFALPEVRRLYTVADGVVETLRLLDKLVTGPSEAVERL